MNPHALAGSRDECTVILDSDGLDRFHRFLASSWSGLRQLAPVEPDWEFEFSTMLGELIANVARHAYAGTPERNRWLQVRLEMRQHCLSAELRDRGQPFENAEERLRAAESQEDSIDHESGRGLRILAQLADTLEYDRTESGENVWRVTRCLDRPSVDEPKGSSGPNQDAK